MKAFYEARIEDRPIRDRVKIKCTCGRVALIVPRSVEFALPVVVALLASLGGCAQADTAEGQKLSQQWCSQCHGVRPGDPSRNPKAPSFLAVALEPSVTEHSLRVFLRIPHWTISNGVITPGDVDDITAYIASLNPR